MNLHNQVRDIASMIRYLVLLWDLVLDSQMMVPPRPVSAPPGSSLLHTKGFCSKERNITFK